MHQIHRRAFLLAALLLTEACHSAHLVTTPPPSGARIEVVFAPRGWVVLDREDASDTALAAVALYGRLRDRRGDTLVIALSTVQPEEGRRFYTSETQVTTRIVPGPGINVLESRYSGSKTALAVLGGAAGLMALAFLIFIAGMSSLG